MLARAPATATRPKQQQRQERQARRPPQPPVRREAAATATTRAKAPMRRRGDGDNDADAAPRSPLPSPLLHSASALGLASALLLAAPPAWASQRVCFDAPDWAAGPLTAATNDPASLFKALLASPPLAAAAAALAAALVPRLLKLARASLKYVLLALGLWVAVSHPRESAGAVQAALEFGQAHPRAASSLLVAAVAVSLGPEVLGTGALVGLLVLFASAAGVIELPAMPRLPRLPDGGGVGAAVVQRLERAVGGGGGGGGAQEQGRGGG